LNSIVHISTWRRAVPIAAIVALCALVVPAARAA